MRLVCRLDLQIIYTHIYLSNSSSNIAEFMKYFRLIEIFSSFRFLPLKNIKLLTMKFFRIKWTKKKCFWGLFPFNYFASNLIYYKKVEIKHAINLGVYSKITCVESNNVQRSYLYRIRKQITNSGAI